MAVRRFVWRACYQALAKRVSTPEWAFMNYGYAPTTVDLGTPPLRSSDERDRLCIQLYLHAIGHCDLRDGDVLEVGSGRGGGASFVSRYLHPRSVTGMDFSPEAVALCNRHRLAPGLAFVCGDAQSMPFPASSFDAVINIESSHCYESMDTFLSEVRRVLRPGGWVFFADLRNVDSVNTLRERFNACGLTVEKETMGAGQRTSRNLWAKQAKRPETFPKIPGLTPSRRESLQLDVNHRGAARLDHLLTI
jgi:ubiquinone/menaquinone biosynthesis C-methylase UbiE